MRTANTGPQLSTVGKSIGPMGRAAYDRLDAMNYSRLKHIVESPLHMKDRPPFEGSNATDFGSIVDEMLLGKLPNAGPSFMVNPYPDFRTKNAQQWRDEMNSNGIIIANQFMIEGAQRLCNNIRSDDHTKKIIDASQKQYVIVAEINGVLCKGRADMIYTPKPKADGLKLAYPIDLKTADSIANSDIRRKIFNFGYYIQAGMYTLLLEAHGYTVPDYRWLFAESSKPFDWRWVKFDSDDLAFSKEVVINLVAQYDKCRKTDTWPGYSKEITTIGFSSYAKQELGANK